MYSIAFPNPESDPPRFFPGLGSSEPDRVRRSIGKWWEYTSGCLDVREVAGERYLAIPYESVPEFYSDIEQLTGIRLEKKLDFRRRDVDEHELARMDPFWSEQPAAEQLRHEVEELVRSLISLKKD